MENLIINIYIESGNNLWNERKGLFDQIKRKKYRNNNKDLFNSRRREKISCGYCDKVISKYNIKHKTTY